VREATPWPGLEPVTRAQVGDEAFAAALDEISQVDQEGEEETLPADRVSGSFSLVRESAPHRAGSGPLRPPRLGEDDALRQRDNEPWTPVGAQAPGTWQYSSSRRSLWLAAIAGAGLTASTRVISSPPGWT